MPCMVKNFSYLLRALVAVVAVGALAAAPSLLAGSAQAAQAPQVTLKTSAHAVKTTGSFTLTAKTVHKVPGTKVVLQQKDAFGWEAVKTFPFHAGGKLTWSHPSKGDHRLRAVLKKQGSTLDISPVVVIHVTAPKKAGSGSSSGGSAPATHACTQTSTGSCIRGGEFCSQSMYGHTGYDANGRSWICTGDHTHPHWE